MTSPVIGASALVSFSFQSSFNVRIVTVDGEPWFMAKDVATALGYADTDQAVRNHCKRAKSLKDIDPSNQRVEQNQELDPKTKFIPEPDVYRLITRSKLPSAEAFETWLFETVIPSIRKTGGYQLPAHEVEKISPKQVQELGRAIDRSLIGWVFNTQDQQQIYNVLHVLLNIRHITDLPASEFDRAMALVAVISEQNHAFLVLVSDLRRDYLKNHLQAGIPWTNHLVREWKKRFKTALPARPDWIEIQRQLRSTESLPETQA